MSHLLELFQTDDSSDFRSDDSYNVDLIWTKKTNDEEESLEKMGSCCWKQCPGRFLGITRRNVSYNINNLQTHT